MISQHTTLAVVARVRVPVLGEESPTNIAGVWRTLPDTLRWLLTSDVFIRTCEGMVDVFLVLYAINIIGVSAPQFGLLIAVQTVTAMISYFPAARLADRTGRKPFVIAKGTSARRNMRSQERMRSWWLSSRRSPIF